MPLTAISLVRAHFLQSDPRIAEVLENVKLSDWFEKRVQGDYFISLCRDIIFQQLAGKAASTIYGRFETLIGGHVDPEHIVGIPDQALRDVGLSWAKVKYVKDLADKTLSGEINLHNLADLADPQVITELTKVKGIGKWTAEMFLIFTLEREDVFSYGDLGLKKGFAKLYGIDDPTPAQIEQVVSRWAPYRSYGSISLWHFLDNV